MKVLRDGNASLTIEMEKLKRELVCVIHQLHGLRHRDSQHQKCVSTTCVLPRLRQKLALKMQARLKQFTSCFVKRKINDSDQSQVAESVNGVHRGVIKARVECSLHQFESLSRHIITVKSRGTLFFFPDSAFTQLPLDCSDEFCVLFKTFSQLCEVIGVTSTTDKKEMARKCGESGQGELLRMLGTYQFDEENDQSPSIFFPGASCGVWSGYTTETPGRNHSERNDTAGTRETLHVADQLTPVLERKTREWNPVDARFVHRLKMTRSQLSQLQDSCSHIQAFSIMWKRAGDITGKGWSTNLTDSNEIFGWLEVRLPFVQTQGKQRCQELASLANDDLWDDILRPVDDDRN